MAEEAGDYDFSDVGGMGTAVAHTHHSEEEERRGNSRTGMGWRRRSKQQWRVGAVRMKMKNKEIGRAHV